MRCSNLLASCLVIGLILPGAPFAQGGLSGSGRGSIGGLVVGGDFGRNDGLDGRDSGRAFDPAAAMPGNWLIEILVDEDSTDPKARGGRNLPSRSTSRTSGAARAGEST